MARRIVIAQDHLADCFKQACVIIERVRYYRKRFEQNHDAGTKATMKEWEKKADQFLDSLVTEPDTESQNQETNEQPGN